MIEISAKVSGCIVTYNNAHCIEETISTLLEHTKGVDFSLTVVDNGSSDGTVELIEERYPQVRVIRSPSNVGFGAGHNTVRDGLDSDYHCVINPDISVKSDVVSDMAEYMDKNPDIGMLSPKICFPNGRPQILGKRNPKLKYLIASRLRNEKEPGRLLREYAMLDEDLTVARDIENATGCFMFFRTSVFKQIGGFDERYFMYFEDCDITRMTAKVSRAVYYPYVTVYHVWGRESKKNMKLMLIQTRSMFSYFLKWRGD